MMLGSYIQSKDEEISKLRLMAERFKIDNKSSTKDWREFVDLPDRFENVKLKRVAAVIRAGKESHIKAKYFTKMKQIYARGNLNTRPRIDIQFDNWKGFLTILSGIFYNMYMKSFPSHFKTEGNSFMMFKNQIQGLKTATDQILTPFKAFYKA